jgi:hypothetical protein
MAVAEVVTVVPHKNVAYACRKDLLKDKEMREES